MAMTINRPKLVTSARNVLAHNPLRAIIWMTPLGIIAMIFVDLVLGANAEYYNAARFLEAWGRLLTGASWSQLPEFMMGQAELGAAPALAIGTAVLFVEPALVLAGIILPISWVIRRRSRSGARSATRIHTEVEVNATPQEVWTVLTDLEAYGHWNPYHVAVAARGELERGTRLVVRIHKPNGEQLTIKPKVIRAEIGRELTWGGGVKGIFRGEHRFLLEPTATGTRLIHSEVFTGFAVRYASLGSIAEGYDMMNRALQDRVESSSARPTRSGPTALRPVRGL